MKTWNRIIKRICGVAILACLTVGVFTLHADTARAEEENYFVRGASVRLVDNTHSAAIKFHVLMTLDEFEQYGSTHGDTLTLDSAYTTGTLTMPYELLNGEALTVAYAADNGEKACFQDTTSLWQKVYVGDVEYAESIVYLYDIPSCAYATEFAVRGVILKDGEPIRYTAQENGISLSYVAAEEYRDKNTKLDDTQLQALYEEYIRKQVNIVIDGVTQTQYVEYLGLAEMPTIPERQEDGDEFTGFYTDSNEKFIFDTRIKNHVTVYARYKESIALNQQTPSLNLADYQRNASDVVKGIVFTAASGTTYDLGQDPTDVSLGAGYATLKTTVADHGEGAITAVLHDGKADYTLQFPAVVITAKIATESELKSVLTYKTSNPYFDAQKKAVFGYFRLTEDITVADWSNNYYKTEGGITHADKTQGFRGVLDGAMHTLNGNYTGSYGLFASIGAGGLIKDAAFQLKTYYNVAFGTVFGAYIQGATLENVTVITNATQRYTATATESAKYTNVGYLAFNGVSGSTFKDVTVKTGGDIYSLFGGYATRGYELTELGQNGFDGVVIDGANIDYIGFKDKEDEPFGVTVEEEIFGGGDITYNGKNLHDYVGDVVLTENQDIVLGGANAASKQGLNVGGYAAVEAKEITFYAASGNTYDLGKNIAELTIPNELRENVKDHGPGRVIITTKWNTTIKIPVTVVTCEITSQDLDQNAAGPFMYTESNPYFDTEAMTIDGYFTLASNVSICSTPNNSSSSTISFNYDDINAGFIGTFDGRGYTLNHTSSGQWGAASTRGLFGQLGTGAVVKDVTIVMWAYTHSQYSAVFATSAYSTTFENVTVTAKQDSISGYDAAVFYLTGFLTAHSISGCTFNGLTVNLNGQRIKSLFGGRASNGYEEEGKYPGQNIYNEVVINGIVDYMGTGHDANRKEYNFTIEEEILLGGNITYNGKSFDEYLPTTNYLISKDNNGEWYSDYTIIYDEQSESGTTAAGFIAEQIQRLTGGVVYTVDTANKGRFNETLGGYRMRTASVAKWHKNARYIVIGNEELRGEAGLATPVTEGSDYTIQWKDNSLFIFSNNENDYISAAIRFLEETIGYKGLSDDYIAYDDVTSVDLKSVIASPINSLVAFDNRETTKGILYSKATVQGVNARMGQVWSVWPDIPESVSSRYENYYAANHNSVLWVPKEAATVGNDATNWFTTTRTDNKAYDLCYTAHGDGESYQRMVQVAANNIYGKLVEAGASATKKVDLSFSIMDDYSVDMCQCDTCKGLYDANGGGGMDTAIMLRFLTDVANAIEQKSPSMQFTIYTAAYHCYEMPPTGAQLEAAGVELVNGQLNEHLGIIYASAPSARDYTVASAQSIYAEVNDQIRANMQRWDALTDNVALWFYTTFFYNYMMPFGSHASVLTWIEYAARLFQDDNFKWGFVQGQHGNRMTTAFDAFKSYAVQMAEMEILDKVKTDIVEEGRNSANYATYQKEMAAYLLELEGEFFGFTVGMDGNSKTFNNKGYYGPAAANEAMYEFYTQMLADYQAMLGNKTAMTYDAETRSVSNQPIMYGKNNERYDYMTYKRFGITYYAKYNVWLTSGKDTDAYFANWEKDTINGYMTKLEIAMAAVESMTDVNGVKAVYKQHVLIESLFPRFVLCNGNHSNYWASGYNHTGASYWSGNLTAARTSFKADCEALGITGYRESLGNMELVYARWGIS